MPIIINSNHTSIDFLQFRYDEVAECIVLFNSKTGYQIAS